MKTTRTEITAKQDRANSARIEASRRAAGGEMHRCPTCCRPVAEPHRRILNGAIVEGCVNASHSAHMIGATNTAAWHHRPAARAIRATEMPMVRAFETARAS